MSESEKDQGYQYSFDEFAANLAKKSAASARKIAESATTTSKAESAEAQQYASSAAAAERAASEDGTLKKIVDLATANVDTRIAKHYAAQAEQQAENSKGWSHAADVLDSEPGKIRDAERAASTDPRAIKIFDRMEAKIDSERKKHEVLQTSSLETEEKTEKLIEKIERVEEGGEKDKKIAARFSKEHQSARLLHGKRVRHNHHKHHQHPDSGRNVFIHAEKALETLDDANVKLHKPAPSDPPHPVYTGPARPLII